MKRFAVCVTVAITLVASVTAGIAEEEQGEEQEKKGTPVALTIGVFFPSSSEVKDQFEDSWTVISLKAFDADKPTAWRFTMELGAHRLNGRTAEARLYPLTFGAQRALKEGKRLQPYVVLRAGPYLGTYEDPTAGIDDRHVGLNANAALGLTINRNLYAELRYDYFTDIADQDFSGLSALIGVRLFDLPK